MLFAEHSCLYANGYFSRDTFRFTGKAFMYVSKGNDAVRVYLMTCLRERERGRRGKEEREREEEKCNLR